MNSHFDYLVDMAMSRRQFKALRKTVGSQRHVAKEMGIYVRSISRWETGEVPLPKIAELALLYLAEHRHTSKPKQGD